MEDSEFPPQITEKNDIIVSLPEVFKRANLDYTRLILSYGDCGNIENAREITAEDYLNFAKADFSETAQDRGRVNAITNAKRAIDCQIDDILFSLGCDLKKNLPNITQKIADSFCDDETKKLLNPTPKLALIAALNISPMTIIAETRALRNAVEHYYIIPDKKAVRKAIEIAEMFIAATKMKFINSQNFSLRDTRQKTKGHWARKNEIVIHRPYSTGLFFDEISYWYFEGTKLTKWIYPLNLNDETYWLAIRMAFSFDSEPIFRPTFSRLLQLAEVNIPYDKIKYKLSID